MDVPDGTELGALGAAIAASVACGCHPSYQEAIAAMVRFSRRQQPNPARRDIYEAKYQRYGKLVDALDPFWPDLKENPA